MRPDLRDRARRSARDLALRTAASRGLFVGRRPTEDAVLDTLGLLAPRPVGHGFVRLGSAQDGGYVVPDDLDGITDLVSPGVSDEIGFDLAALDRLGPDARAHLFDASVEGPPVDDPRIRFTRLHLDSRTDEGVTTLADAVAGVDAPGDLMLQMDVEGAEYRILQATPSSVLARFRVVLIELHHLQDLCLHSRLHDLRAALLLLHRTHVPCHVHANNAEGAFPVADQWIPRLLETTWLRRDRVRDGVPLTSEARRSLDRDCVPTRPGLALPDVLGDRTP